MKKQTFFILFIISLIGMCFACSDDKLSGPKEKGINSFTKEDAKKLFETKATNLLSVSLARESRATSRTMENNAPDWSKAETRITDQSIIIEVPMESNAVSRVFQKEWGVVGQQNRITAAFMKLIVAQRNGGNKEMFVVTFIPDCLTPRFVHNLEQNTRYYGGTFSGILLCSDLDGTLRTAFRYVNGVNKGELVFGYKSELGDDYQSEEGDVVIRINNFIATRSFGDDESFVGGGGLCEHQKDPFTCNFCNAALEEVVVKPSGKFCTGCHRFLHSKSDCICCPTCKQWPCTCVCPFCGFKPCRCDERCSICDKIPCVHPCDYCRQLYCHGQCHGGGGGSGSNPNPNPSDTTNIGGDKITVNNFVEKVFTPEFLAKVLKELGIDANTIPITFENRPSNNNGGYDFQTRTLNFNPIMFERGYNNNDITSIAYHELIHAKQDILDHRVAEIDSKGQLVTKEYVFPCDDFYIEEGLRDFHILMKDMNIPSTGRNEAQEGVWKAYYQNYVGSREEEKRLGKTYTERANYNYSKNEAEAYEVQLREYGSNMSAEYRESVERNKKLYSRVVRVIENQ